MYSLDVATKSGENKSIIIRGKYCGGSCSFKQKMFQGFGGWLGFEVDGCALSGEQLRTDKGKPIRCEQCLHTCKEQIETHGLEWKVVTVNPKEEIN